MGLWIHLREALANLLGSKLRSILAILGILVGTGAVVALITSSELATNHALAQFKTLGTNLLAVSISSNDAGGEGDSISAALQLSDVPKIVAASPEILDVAPYVTMYSNMSYGDKMFSGGAVVGATKIFADVAKIEIDRGRFPSLLDRANPFAVVGAELAAELHSRGLFDPIGHQIMVGDSFFTIIGIMKPWKPNMFIYLTMNKSIMIPIESASLVSKYSSLNNILIRLKKDSPVQVVQDQVQGVLQNLLPTAQISIRNPLQILELVGKQQQTFTWLLGAIGGISLLVGGIGVMNIMLVSVVERRREIGIRLAIGAQQRDILYMFLIESVMLTLFGGILGIIVGLAISYTLAYISKWGFAIFIMPPILGFVVSVAVGILSGFYPAYRASKLDPIESLHAE